MKGRDMTCTEYRRWRYYAEPPIEQAIDAVNGIDRDAVLEDGGDWDPSVASPVCEGQLCGSADSHNDREQVIQSTSSG